MITPIPYLSEETPMPDSPDHYILKFDGGCWPNPGPMAAGYIIIGPHRQPIVRFGAKIGDGTNNLAEYHALFLGLKHCIRLGIRRLTCLGDSLLVINQLLGNWKLKNNQFKNLHADILRASKALSMVNFGWISRDDNEQCDQLTKLEEDYHLEGPSGFNYMNNSVFTTHRRLTKYQAALCQLLYMKGLVSDVDLLADIMGITRKCMYNVVNQDAHALLTEYELQDEHYMLKEANANPLYF